MVQVSNGSKFQARKKINTPRLVFGLLFLIAVPVLLFQNCGQFHASDALVSSASLGQLSTDETEPPRDETGNLVVVPQIDTDVPPASSPASLEFVPALDTATVNQAITVNWNAGAGASSEQVRGQIRLASGSCQASNTPVQAWGLVQKKARGAGALEISSSLIGCQVDYCLIVDRDGQAASEICRRLQVREEEGWVKLAMSHQEAPAGHEIAYQWSSSRAAGVSGTVRLDGSNCPLNGRVMDWNSFMGLAPGSTGVAVRASDRNYANCTARVCLTGQSMTGSLRSLEDCQNIKFNEPEWRPTSWVRDGRYLYEPSLDITPHITWSIQNDPSWVSPITEVAIGYAPGSADIVPWTSTTSSIVQLKVASGKFDYGQFYFASVRVKDASGKIVATASGNGWRFIRSQDPPRLAPYSREIPTWTNESLREVADDDFVGFRTADDIEPTRQKLIRQLWPREGRLPTALPTEIRAEPRVLETLNTVIGTQFRPGVNDSSELQQITPDIADATGSLQRLVIRLPSGLESHAFYFKPRKNAVNRLAIVHQGHDDVLGTFGGGRSILFFLRNGFDVVAFFMPASGPNDASFRDLFARQTAYQVASGTRPYHNDLFELARRLPSGALGEHPVAVYLSPVRIALNHLTRQSQYQDITMIGCSGGGWTTTLYAALDPQIRYSFPIAGSLPLPLRRYRPVDYSDAEQHSGDIYSIAGYTDLYVMGASGAGRKQVQVLNGNDDCCMRPSSAPNDPAYVTPYTNIHENYVSKVARAASDFGGFFTTRIDEPSVHTISNWTLWTVVAPILGVTPRPSLTMNGLAGSDSQQSRTKIRGDAELQYEWSCENCTGPVSATFDFGGSCGASAADAPIDWIQGVRGSKLVPGAASRIGCWIDFKMRTAGSSVVTTKSFDWVSPAAVPARAAPRLTFTMNGETGSSDPSNRKRIRGDIDLVYDWNCENCERPPRATYNLGGTCGSATGVPIEWMNTIRGHQFVPGAAARVGCWIDFIVLLPDSGTLRTFRYDWVAPGS